MSECEVGLLLEQVADLLQPPVYSSAPTCSSHTSGFCAVAYFRGGHEPHMREVTYWADTPEEALEGLLQELKEKYGPCPHCGRSG
jgi:hypothetical protein